MNIDRNIFVNALILFDGARVELANVERVFIVSDHGCVEADSADELSFHTAFVRYFEENIAIENHLMFDFKSHRLSNKVRFGAFDQVGRNRLLIILDDFKLFIGN